MENKTISSSVEKQTQVDSKSSQVRTYPNGLVVEELSMGRPNGKKAEPGKQVCTLNSHKLHICIVCLLQCHIDYATRW